MAKEYMNKAPAIASVALLIFTFFSGFGWLYVLKENIANPNNWQQILLNSFDKTFYDVGCGGSSWLYLFPRPLSYGFVLTFTLMLLLKRTDLTKQSFIISYGLLVMSLAFMHPPELILYVLFLAVVSIFKPSNFEIRLDESLTATFLGITSTILIQLSFRLIGFGASDLFYHLIILLLVTLIAKLCIKFKKKTTHLKVNRSLLRVLLYAIMLFYFYGLLVWIEASKSFSTSLVGGWSVYLVPWYFYPPILGVSGILAIIYLLFSLTKEQSDPNDVFFVYLIVFSLVFGRILSFVNINLFYTGYHERRISLFAITGVSLLAAKGLRMISRIHISKKLLRIGICFIVVMGSTTTFLTLDFWNTYLNNATYLSEEEWAAQHYLYSFVQKHPDTIVYTVSDRTMWSLGFASPRLVVQTISPILWSSKSPITALNMLYGVLGANTTKVIYIHERDFECLALNYPGGYVFNYLLNQLPLLYANSEVKIYYVPKGTPPLSESNAVIARDPSEINNPIYGEVYNLISTNFYNYTIRNIYELYNIENDSLIIFPQDNRNYLALLHTLHNKTVMVINPDSFGPIADLLFKSNVKITISSDDVILMNADNANLSKIDVNPLGESYCFGVSCPKTVPELVLADDNQITFWQATPYGKAGEGNISIAELENDDENNVSGLNSLKINVGEGTYKFWQISHDFESPQDWSSFDFLSFWWYGHGDGNAYVVEMISSSGSYWHKFKDSWHGWGYVLIPLKMPSGHFDIGGVALDKSALKEASWDSIKTINIRLCGDNPNVKGTFHIDKVSLIKGTLSTIHVLIDNVETSKGVNISFKNKTLSFESTDLKTLDARDIFFYGNTRGDLLFGSTSIGYASSEFSSERSSISLNITLVLPPNIYRRGILSDISISYTSSSISITKISDEKEAFTTPYLNSTLFSARNGTNVIARYMSANGEEIPAIASLIFNDIKIYYVNIIPLLRCSYKRSEFNVTSELFGKLIALSRVGLVKQIDVDHWGLNDMIGTPTLSINGSISIASTSTFINQTKTPLHVQVLLDYDTIEFDIFSLQVCGLNMITFNTTKPVEIGGYDFYSLLTLQCQRINVNVSRALSICFTVAGNRSVCLEKARSISISGNGNEVQLTIRTPHISVVGEVKFFKCKVRGTLSSKFGDSRDIFIKGYAEFVVSLTDTYKIVEEFDYNATIKVTPPLCSIDEIKDFFNNLPYLLLVLIILISSLFVKIETKNR
jgi:hypothetical protein